MKYKLILAGLLMATLAQANVPGVIYKTAASGGGEVRGDVRWRPAAQAYAVTRGGVTLNVPLNEVESVQVQEPPNLAGAIQQVRQGMYGSAVPVLQGIMRDYQMLQHDVTAAQYLAQAYLKQKQYAQAIRMCEEVMRANPGALRSGELAGIYWEALLEDGREATLNRELTKAIAEGSRAVAAVAQIKRGDLEQRKGNLREALVNGYLRTVILYQDVKPVQPEALFKAVKAFEQLGQLNYAENMRKRLLAEFPNHEYSRQLRSGT